MIKPLAWLRPLFASPRPLAELQTADGVIHRYRSWRRRMLLLVLVLTSAIAIIDTTKKMRGESGLAFNLVIWLDPETTPPVQTLFGDLADLAWMLSFYAMPVAALLATVFWSRLHLSRSLLLAGWTLSFLVPVAIALTPWDWWTVDRAPAATRAIELATQYDRIAEGMAWGYYYVLVLSPAVLALVPGMLRACVRVKQLLPASILPGWILVVAAPFNSLLVLVVVVALTQIAPSPLLLTGMFLWLAAPLAYLARASAITRPFCSPTDLRELARVQTFVWVMIVVSLILLIAYAATWEVSGLRLIGLDHKRSLFRPWQVARYFLDFLGRSLFITVLGADLLLWATLSAWRHQRDFSQSARAAEYDHLMEQLSTPG